MRPEDIQNHDFLVGLRGYDKVEVRAFLAEVAAEHAALLAAVRESEANAAAIPADTEGLREQAQQQLAEAERLVREATERVRQIEIEHDARMNDKAAEVARREEAMRQRLLEAADELQLALMALTDESQPIAASQQEEQAPALG